MAFDYKKEYKEFYMPKNTPSIVTVPSMNYIAVRGHGDPNPEESEYKQLGIYPESENSENQNAEEARLYKPRSPQWYRRL